ncbi:MAG: hypothetical protein E7032_01575 [Akkermansiaceae bacterium]|nr:hypothetical protein [Akkermansiaceae bacterium]
MKNTSLLLSLLALGFSMAQAAQVYTITLTSAERFTDCTVIYKSSSTTKFRGKDKAGKTVTREIPTGNIIMMREVVKDEPEPEQKDEAPSTPAPAAAETNADATPAAQTPAGAPAAEGEQKAEPIADGNIAQRAGEEKAKDATLRLREKLTNMETLMSKISKPSRALQSQVSQVKRRVTSQLEDMDKKALEVARLQEEFNKAGAADFTFDKVSVEQRDQFMRDGEAAYKAMRIDMKEKKGRRKVAGLDKFEIMRERYQGIPEYKQAYEWYVKTLYALQKKWTAMHNKEENARKRLPADKKSLRQRQDNAEYENIAAKLKEDGDDIATVWFTPPARNLKMLSISVNKVKDAIRRNEDRPLDDEVGTVPSLITQFWDNMDKVRMSMVTGDLEAAEKQLRENGAYPIIMRLKNYILPNEYRTPIVEQYKATQKEIQTRMRGYNNLKRSLERATASLDRVTASAEAQIDSATAAVQKELDSDVGDNTMEVEQPKAEAAPAPEQPAAEQK